MKMLWGFLATLIATIALAATAADTRADGTTTTVTFSEVGSKSFTVPAGVTSIHVVAVGAPGGSEGAAAGGLGAVATADVAVTPGEVLGVFVGGTGNSGGLGEGGFNGGGDSVDAEGGGGASDVRIGSPGSLESRLVVAGGGGGAAVGTNSGPIAGGSAGTAGGSSAFNDCTGGGGATATQAGSAGVRYAEAGHLGTGGFAPSKAGGGGGGGLFGGGGGGGYYDGLGPEQYSCGGGGGSNGFGPGTSATSAGIAGTTEASVTISYVVPSAAAGPGSPSGPTGGSPSGPTGGPNGSSPGPSGNAAADLSLKKTQHGKAVTAAIQVPAAESVLDAKLFWQKPKAGKRLVFGHLVEAHLKKGIHSFEVRLNGRGKGKLASLGALKMTLAVDIDPPQGPDGVASRRVTLRGG